MTQDHFSSLLTTFRDFSGRTQKQLAFDMGTSPASVSRWESGKFTPRVETAEALDRMLKADGRLLKAWRKQTSGTELPVWQLNVARLQEQAVAIDCLSPVLVPGELQCSSYAEAVFKDGQPLVGDAEVDRWVSARCGRLKTLREHHHDPVVTSVFPHSALTCMPDHIRKEQAGHLLRLVEDVRVEVHLLSPGTSLIGVTAPVNLYRLLDGGLAVSSDYIAGNVILESDSHPRMEALVRKCLASALPARESRQLLRELEAA
ncbi:MULTISPECIES: Scr1 family TA system antitoxin-like transcriptional regulator [Nocardiopsis]|uniref:Transcriptional regulator, XRE family n=1 Tax=Nocardiopsis dassonvillei (strain ATCC 23218 / DSM 43111 / CIP 107115 / JCM 7437 / KCTC 9190 / NBRC 14626 / NCTC 10488 / NRRL B-5397 / IMRU 509) TaxID=446468 RepID=D7AUY1_NOCDD|nr:Scr1 family TA system antitoxin-like transcriptional regulator [Nocardiopsis dassonvillei]ADH69531.1 transcriptional regulator, XRE family [Nocardiopsis dassonvillei subsp. dassonvillei DSM 43111]APC37535.1 transcriptional regulator [Nocardiopsis dassonvillei]NKY79048.1 helix-turn-helix transcriptional regulator [Nocardiopsis dassonvillei]